LASNHELLELLYRAMDEELGLAVETDNPTALRNKLYILRRQEDLPLGLTIVEDEVYIRRKDHG